jgi:hypothetical protein
MFHITWHIRFLSQYRAVLTWVSAVKDVSAAISAGLSPAASPAPSYGDGLLPAPNGAQIVFGGCRQADRAHRMKGIIGRNMFAMLLMNLSAPSLTTVSAAFAPPIGGAK